jgi:DnaK suppressor protein
MPTQDFVQRMKDRLLEEKERLQEELSSVPEHTEMDPNADEWEDSSPLELQVDEVNQDIRAQLQSDLAGIERSLENVEKGTYGICAIGGEDISEARLEVLPWAESCVEHQNA